MVQMIKLNNRGFSRQKFSSEIHETKHLYTIVMQQLNIKWLNLGYYLHNPRDHTNPVCRNFTAILADIYWAGLPLSLRSY